MSPTMTWLFIITAVWICAVWRSPRSRKGLTGGRITGILTPEKVLAPIGRVDLYAQVVEVREGSMVVSVDSSKSREFGGDTTLALPDTEPAFVCTLGQNFVGRNTAVCLADTGDEVFGVGAVLRLRCSYRIVEKAPGQVDFEYRTLSTDLLSD